MGIRGEDHQRRKYRKDRGGEPSTGERSLPQPSHEPGLTHRREGQKSIKIGYSNLVPEEQLAVS